MSRLYGMSNVQINILAIGSRGPYLMTPYNYRLKCGNCTRSGSGREINDIKRRTCHKCDKCNKYGRSRYRKTKPMPFPRGALMRDQDDQYYDSSEKMFLDRAERINYDTTRQERRKLRRPNIRNAPICPNNWHLTGCQFCKGPNGYSGLRSRAGS